jgi:hypothetical protein
LENNSFGHPEEAFEGFGETYGGRQLLGMVWTRPRFVIRYLLQVEPDKYVLPLLMLMGVSHVLEKAAEKHSGDALSAAGIVLMALVGGPLGGIFSGYVCSGLLSFTGRWLGGEAESYQLRTVQAWASVPAICILLLLPVELLFFGGELFSAHQPTMKASEDLVLEFDLAKAGGVVCGRAGRGAAAFGGQSPAQHPAGGRHCGGAAAAAVVCRGREVISINT